MILICPSCGATHSAEAWENDVHIRKSLQAACGLPAEVSRVLLPYLSLFRPAQRALSWSRSLKIINELAAMVALGHIQVQGKAARHCPPRIWAQAMEQMAARSDLQRPMKNHNYLRQIVYQLADQADARSEAQQRRSEVDGSQRVSRPPADPEGMSEIMRKFIAQQGDDHAAK